MSNEELARQINAGNESLLPVLWDGVERFVRSQAYKFYRTNKGRCRAFGVEVDDLYQMGYFALLMALEVFKRKGDNKIISYMGFHLKNEFNRAIGRRSESQRKSKVKVISLDNQITEDGGTLQDVIKDDSAEDQYINAVERVYQEEIKIIVHENLSKLPQEQQDIINQRYFLNFNMRDTAINLGITYTEAGKNFRKALVALRRSREITALRDEYISSLGLRCTGLSYFNYTWTSAVEYAAMRLEREERYKSITQGVIVPLPAL